VSDRSTQPWLTGAGVRSGGGATGPNGRGVGPGLHHLTRGPPTWELANVVTRAAEDATDYDRATAPEAAGGRVIDPAPAEWRSPAA